MNCDGFFTGCMFHICGYAVSAYIKTGLYTGIVPGGYGFADINKPQCSFGLQGDYFKPEDIGLQMHQKVSILIFHYKKMGPTFLAYNHANQKDKVWAEAIDDLGKHHLLTNSHEQEKQLQNCLGEVKATFDNGEFLSACRNYLRCLYEEDADGLAI